VQKWGNSLAVRVPKAFAAEAGFSENTPVDLSIEDGKLTVQSVARPAITLEALLAGVTNENLHAEVSTGRAKGREEW
jgi:antitoxin MazE